MAVRTTRSLVRFTVRRIRNGNPRHARSFRRLHQRVVAALFSLALLVVVGGALVGIGEAVTSRDLGAVLPTGFATLVAKDITALTPDARTRLAGILNVSVSTMASHTGTTTDDASPAARGNDDQGDSSAGLQQAGTGGGDAAVTSGSAAGQVGSIASAAMSKGQACQMNVEDARYLDAESLRAIQKAVGASQTGTWLTADLESFNAACGYGDYIDGGRTGTNGYGSGSQVTADVGRDPAKEKICLDFKTRWIATGQTTAYADKQYQQCRSNNYANYVFNSQASKGFPQTPNDRYAACIADKSTGFSTGSILECDQYRYTQTQKTQFTQLVDFCLSESSTSKTRNECELQVYQQMHTT